MPTKRALLLAHLNCVTTPFERQHET